MLRRAFELAPHSAVNDGLLAISGVVAGLRIAELRRAGAQAA
jgi:hypothetical protein